ncbi:hypothetical protein [Paraburkholderia sp. BCC1876]|uniref:DUF2471 family protein n=1 Tax=Paraburkholderia sp. BCC1876 TaxID=2676303 RepID=UPI001590A569|nr:hypothetical protein [Paraburkholderia sp. BCC1876]
MLEELSRDEVLAEQRAQAAFLTDVSRVVATIATRHHAASSPLTWQLLRDIREEALAAIGLAARWPAWRLDEIVAASAVPPLDGCPTGAEVGALPVLGRAIAAAFHIPEPYARTK